MWPTCFKEWWKVKFSKSIIPKLMTHTLMMRTKRSQGSTKGLWLQRLSLRPCLNAKYTDKSKANCPLTLINCFLFFSVSLGSLTHEMNHHKRFGHREHISSHYTLWLTVHQLVLKDENSRRETVCLSQFNDRILLMNWSFVMGGDLVLLLSQILFLFNK